MASQELGSNLSNKRKAFAILGGLVLGGFLIALAEMKHSPGPTIQTKTALNQQGVELATNGIIDDLKSDLLGGNSMLGKDSDEELSYWTGITQKTTARVYEKAYDGNEIAADNQFKDKKVFISGSIMSVEKDFTGSGFLTLQGSEPFLGVRANLNDAGLAGAASFSKGQNVGLVCTGGGRIITIAVLGDCQLLTDYMAVLQSPVRGKVTRFLNAEITLKHDTAGAIVALYVGGSMLSPTSPCVTNFEACTPDLMLQGVDNAKRQAMKARVDQMMSSLKVAAN